MPLSAQSHCWLLKFFISHTWACSTTSEIPDRSHPASAGKALLLPGSEHTGIQTHSETLHSGEAGSLEGLEPTAGKCLTTIPRYQWHFPQDTKLSPRVTSLFLCLSLFQQWPSFVWRSCWVFSHSLSLSYENTTVSTKTSVTNYSNTDEMPTPSQHTSASNLAVRMPGQTPPGLPLQEICAMGPRHATYMCVAMTTNSHFHTRMPVADAGRNDSIPYLFACLF